MSHLTDVILNLADQLRTDPTQEHLWGILADAFEERGDKAARKFARRIRSRRLYRSDIQGDIGWARGGLPQAMTFWCPTMFQFVWQGSERMKSNPIRRMRIRDRRPYPPYDFYGAVWLREDSQRNDVWINPFDTSERINNSCLPSFVHFRLRKAWHPTRIEARRALNHACFEWLKSPNCRKDAEEWAERQANRA